MEKETIRSSSSWMRTRRALMLMLMVKMRVVIVVVSITIPSLPHRDSAHKGDNKENCTLRLVPLIKSDTASESSSSSTHLKSHEV